MDYTNDIIPILFAALKKMEQSFKLVIRLHPLDATAADKYSCFNEFPHTEFSVKEDLYSQVAVADYIIGSYSTALYDSVFFSKVPLIHKNDRSDYFVPAELGPRFSNSDELLALLQQQPSPDSVKEISNHLWKRNCAGNFLGFWEKFITN
jgi:hypothetical protein